MRLFIALDLPVPIRDELAAAQKHLQASGARPLRWAHVGGLHLTLQFLGERPAELVDPLLAALAGLPPVECTLRLAGFGAFPAARNPQVLWVGIAGDFAALHELQRRVVAVTAPLGIEAETRPYQPHLTLGRVPEYAGRQHRINIGVALEQARPPASLEWQSGPPLLYESVLTAQGPQYRALGGDSADAGKHHP
jgi:2'-5' RNA ligase